MLNPEKYSSDEVSWAVILAEHLFSRLSLGGRYKIDHFFKGKRKLKEKGEYYCACSKKEQLTGSFGDTSYGCRLGWHGSVDLLIENDVPVAFVSCEEQLQASDGDEIEHSSVCSDCSSASSIDVKTSNKFSARTNMQILSQCIAFSFLQPKIDPGSKNCLVPLIGICQSKIRIVFYDSEKDVLLMTAQLKLVGSPHELFPKITVLLWLVLNYKLFCTGVPTDFDHFKAMFPEKVGDKIIHYVDDIDVKIGTVQESGEDETWTLLEAATPTLVYPGVPDPDSESDTEQSIWPG